MVPVTDCSDECRRCRRVRPYRPVGVREQAVGARDPSPVVTFLLEPGPWRDRAPSPAIVLTAVRFGCISVIHTERRDHEPDGDGVGGLDDRWARGWSRPLRLCAESAADAHRVAADAKPARR